MAHVLDSGEQTTQRLPKQWSKSRLIVPQFATVYTARLNAVQNHALLKINHVLPPASFAIVYVQGTAATTGSTIIRGKRR